MDQTAMRQFRKSMVVGPAEAALKRADNLTELDALWEDYCDGFADESPEREYLRKLYDERKFQFDASARAARMLRV